MIHYINISKKRLVGRNNQPNSIPLILDFHTLGNIQFCLIDDKNQVRALPENCTLTFAGSVKMGENSSNILFLSTTYTVSEDNVINFTVDTYTEPFLTQIKKKNTEINVEISIKFEDGHQKLLLRDYAYACPRVYIEGLPPSPVEYYYTKEEVDAKLDEFQPISGMVDYALKSDVPTKTSELVNDSGYITSGQVDFSDYYTKEETDLKLDEKADVDALSAYQPVSGMVDYALKSDIPSGGGSGGGYTFPLEQRTFICMSESVSEDGSIEMQQIDSEYNRSSGNRYINNVVVIPSGAPSGKVDFVYEETSGFVYNPFTTVKFQLDCIPSKEMSSLQEIYFIVEKAGEETVIATTEGLNSNTIHRYNSQNDNSIFCSQVIELKNILADEFVSVIGDKVKLRFLFAYRYFGTSNQKNAPSDQKQQFTVSVGDTKNGRYCFFLSINKSFSNSDLPHDPLKYYADYISGVRLKENMFDYSQIRYPMDALQKRNLAFMLNDTGIFGKAQDASYNYDEYHYHFNNYIEWSSDYALYDDIYLNNKLDIGGKVRGYTLNGSVTLDANNYGGYFHFIMFNNNNISFNNIENYFSIFPVFFVKHKIFIYNPNGFQLLYQDTNFGKSEDIISTSETGIIELNFYIDYDSIGLTSYSSDYYYVLEKINADGTKVKYPYKKNW